jgi:hypothetical protein
MQHASPQESTAAAAFIHTQDGGASLIQRTSESKKVTVRHCQSQQSLIVSSLFFDFLTDGRAISAQPYIFVKGFSLGSLKSESCL